MAPITPTAEVAMYAAAYRESRRRRNAAIVLALDAGCAQDEIAHAAGITASAVRKVRDEARKDTTMTTATDERDTAAREHRARRLAGKHGLALRKSRDRDTHLTGTYGLVDVSTGAWVAHSGEGHGLTLGQIEDDLTKRSPVQ